MSRHAPNRAREKRFLGEYIQHTEHELFSMQDSL